MNIAVVLATGLLRIGTDAVPGATTYDWTIHYVDGAEEIYHTAGHVLEFPARDGHCFNAVVCTNDLCSVLSHTYCVNPIPGDVNFDCAVGVPDFQDVGVNYGRRCGE